MTRCLRRDQHQDVAPFGNLVDRADGEAGILRGRDPAGRRREAVANLDAGVAQVECVGVALRAVADDGDFLGLDQTEISVAVVEDAGHWEVPCGSGTSLTSRNEELEIGVGAPRVIAPTPVRTISRTRDRVVASARTLISASSRAIDG